ncbi:uncharacterized protein [Periplaneta americana]|uniref:uncharacterized protein n=1 Tax=Periplaneta americana TaxID=6978 RepID=UPI0037E98ACF
MTAAFTWFSAVLLSALLTATLGAPRYSQVSPLLFERLQRSKSTVDIPDSLNALLDNNEEYPKQAQSLEDQAKQLAEILKNNSNFQHRENGGSFSPPRHENSDSGSLPEFNRIPGLRNNCPTCVPDSYRWEKK